MEAHDPFASSSLAETYADFLEEDFGIKTVGPEDIRFPRADRPHNAEFEIAGMHATMYWARAGTTHSTWLKLDPERWVQIRNRADLREAIELAIRFREADREIIDEQIEDLRLIHADWFPGFAPPVPGESDLQAREREDAEESARLAGAKLELT